MGTHWEQEEQFLQLGFVEVMDQEFLRVCPQTGDVVVLAFMLAPQVCNTLLDILCDLRSRPATKSK